MPRIILAVRYPLRFPVLGGKCSVCILFQKINRSILLPITGFDYGLLRGKANFTVGNLVCKGLCNNRNIQNIRHSRYNDPSPSRYNERHSLYDYDTVCDLT